MQASSLLSGQLLSPDQLYTTITALTALTDMSRPLTGSDVQAIGKLLSRFIDVLLGYETEYARDLAQVRIKIKAGLIIMTLSVKMVTLRWPALHFYSELFKSGQSAARSNAVIPLVSSSGRHCIHCRGFSSLTGATFYRQCDTNDLVSTGAPHNVPLNTGIPSSHCRGRPNSETPPTTRVNHTDYSCCHH